MLDPKPVFADVAEALLRLYSGLMHRLEVQGAEHVPTLAQRQTESGTPRGLLIVSNHTAGLDPLLIQSAMPGTFVRWVMARDMAEPSLQGLWEWCQVILVDRTGKPDLPAVREMTKTLQCGGNLGLFPEGRLRAHGAALGEFQPGLGLIIARTKPLVLPVVVSGTPKAKTAWGSLWRRSISRVQIMPVIDYAALGMKANEIPSELRSRYVQWLGE